MNSFSFGRPVLQRWVGWTSNSRVHAYIYVKSDFCFLYAATFYWNLTPMEQNRNFFVYVERVIFKGFIWPNDTIAKWVTGSPSVLFPPGLSIRGQQWTGMLIL